MKITFLLIAMTIGSAAFAQQTSFKFDFGKGEVAQGYIGITPGTFYNEDTGYGFEKARSFGRSAEVGPQIESIERTPKSKKAKADPLTSDFITCSPSFSFSVKLPQGNYKITLILGDAQGTSKTSVRSEQRRLMLEGISTANQEIVTKTFGVNVRDHTLSPGNSIKFDTREWDYQNGKALMNTWDDKLTLTFCDERPCVCAVEIEPIEQTPVIYLLGDSTVTDQAGGTYGTWGQALPRWFEFPVIVSNHAESGQTAKAFRFQRRWDKVVESLKAGDYVLIQFGTNDAKATGHDGMWPNDDKEGEWSFTHTEAMTDYAWALASYAVEIKRHGAIPVIISPMTKIDTRTGAPNTAPLGKYPEGAKLAAQLANCTYINLFDMSLEIVKALGAEAPKAYADGTHSGNYGGYLFSRCIAKGLKDANLDIAKYLIDGAADFNPSQPSPSLEEFNTAADNALPRSPQNTAPAMRSQPAPGQMTGAGPL